MMSTGKKIQLMLLFLCLWLLFHQVPLFAKIFFRQAAEALPKLVDFSEVDFDAAVDERDKPLSNQAIKENATIKPFSSAPARNSTVDIPEQETVENTQNNIHNYSLGVNNKRMSNFDKKMLGLHAFGSRGARSSIAVVGGNNLNSKFRRSSTVGRRDSADTNAAMTGGNRFVNNNNVGEGDIEMVSQWGGVDDQQNEDDEDGDEQRLNSHSTSSDHLDNFNSNPNRDSQSTDDIEEGNFNATSGTLGTISSEGTSFTSKWKSLSKKEFRFRLNLLEKHRKWVEKATRR